MTHPIARALRPRRHSAAVTIGLAGALLVAGCGSSGDDSSPGDVADVAATTDAATTDAATTDAATTDAGSETDASADEATEADPSSASITLTLDDGTVYEITDVSSCDTAATEPESFPLENGYDLTGRTADGAFSFTAVRAGFDDDSAVFSGALEGDFDDDGQNAKMLYALDTEAVGDELVADGASVSGTIDARAVAPTRPHGDATIITVEANC